MHRGHCIWKKYFEEIKEIKQNCLGPGNCNIFFCLMFDHYY